MAGMLPGVECARRRRFHGHDGGGGGGRSDLLISSGYASTRRTNSHESSNSFSRSFTNSRSDPDEKLGGAAMEAKQRLDGKLRRQWRPSPEIERTSSQERLMNVTNIILVEGTRRSMVVAGDLHNQTFRSEKNRSKRFSWGRLGWNWKASEQDECPICLDQFKIDKSLKLTRLPCAHRFHSRCLLPWLESNAHCPCCRTGIVSSN